MEGNYSGYSLRVPAAGERSGPRSLWGQLGSRADNQNPGEFQANGDEKVGVGG